MRVYCMCIANFGTNYFTDYCYKGKGEIVNKIFHR